MTVPGVRGLNPPWPAFDGQSKGNQNQLYLIRLGKKQNWATETSEGGRKNHIGGQPFPQLYQIQLVLVTFFLPPGTLPGPAATRASLF